MTSAILVPTEGAAVRVQYELHTIGGGVDLDKPCGTGRYNAVVPKRYSTVAALLNDVQRAAVDYAREYPGIEHPLLSRSFSIKRVEERQVVETQTAISELL